ncbi:hypothetical protein H4582DRAFT_2056910 [Lactarius indigo]|nr:hypothetical protein H4582DRAFT_2056910 [Lactarius indigo]
MCADHNADHIGTRLAHIIYAPVYGCGNGLPMGKCPECRVRVIGGTEPHRIWDNSQTHGCKKADDSKKFGCAVRGSTTLGDGDLAYSHGAAKNNREDAWAGNQVKTVDLDGSENSHGSKKWSRRDDRGMRERRDDGVATIVDRIDSPVGKDGGFRTCCVVMTIGSEDDLERVACGYLPSEVASAGRATPLN